VHQSKNNEWNSAVQFLKFLQKLVEDAENEGKKHEVSDGKNVVFVRSGGIRLLKFFSSFRSSARCFMMN
jgi:hypothetical protein